MAEPFPSLESLPSAVGEDMLLQENHGHFVNSSGNILFYADKDAPVKEHANPDELLDEALNHFGEVEVLTGFDLESQLREDVLDGPIIEVAGPTAKGFGIIGRLGTMPDNIYRSNIEEQPAGYEDIAKDLLNYVADATALPHRSGSIGAVLTSAIGGGTKKIDARSTRDAMFKEFYRVLKPGGLVVAQWLKPEDIQQAVSEGLIPQVVQVMVAQKTEEDEQFGLAIVLKKPAE